MPVYADFNDPARIDEKEGRSTCSARVRVRRGSVFGAGPCSARVRVRRGSVFGAGPCSARVRVRRGSVFGAGPCSARVSDPASCSALVSRPRRLADRRSPSAWRGRPSVNVGAGSGDPRTTRSCASQRAHGQGCPYWICSACQASSLVESPRSAQMRSTSFSTWSMIPPLMRTLRYSTKNAQRLTTSVKPARVA